jgi:hypothetical protein
MKKTNKHEINKNKQKIKKKKEQTQFCGHVVLRAESFSGLIKSCPEPHTYTTPSLVFTFRFSHGLLINT